MHIYQFPRRRNVIISKFHSCAIAKVLALDIGINQIPLFNKIIGNTDTNTHFPTVLQYSGNTEKILPIQAIPIQYCNINNPGTRPWWCLYCYMPQTLLSCDENMLEAFHMKCQILHICWSQHITNAEVSAHTGLPPILDFIRRRCVSFRPYSLAHSRGSYT